jgi:hypothetical protein
VTRTEAVLITLVVVWFTGHELSVVPSGAVSPGPDTLILHTAKPYFVLCILLPEREDEVHFLSRVDGGKMGTSVRVVLLAAEKSGHIALFLLVVDVLILGVLAWRLGPDIKHASSLCG